jgi:ABC-type Fe3+/spermidine/putrescine transport system ATPase subunit
MRNGRIEQQGDPIALYDNPASAFVADFIGKQNFIPGQRIGSSSTMRSSEGVRLEASRVAPGIAAEAKVLGAVRPENIRLSEAEPVDSVNRIPVRLTAVVMLGDTLEHVLTMHDGSEFLCRASRTAGETPQAGTKIWAQWSPEAFSLLPFEDLGRTAPRLSHS